MPVNLLLNIISNEAQSRDYATFSVAADLSHVIESFVLYKHVSAAESVLAMTDGQPFLVIVLDKDEQYNLSCGSRQNHFTDACLCPPLLENTYIRKMKKAQRLLIVRFTEDGLYHILKKPLSHFRSQSNQDLRQIFGSEFRLLIHQVRHSSARNGIEILESFFRKKVNHETCQNFVLKDAVAYIRESQGQSSIHSLATALNVNYKWLERNFLKYLGVTPKEFARIQRFLYTLKEISGRSGESRRIYPNERYYDQNHFAKDFKRFTGKTPSYFIRELAQGNA